MREYPKEYKIESVKYYLEKSRSKNQAARELGIPMTTLRGWIKKYMNEIKGMDKSKVGKKDYEKALEDRDKRIKQLEEENLILKKSIGIFTRDTQQK
jgi:transposase